MHRTHRPPAKTAFDAALHLAGRGPFLKDGGELTLEEFTTWYDEDAAQAGLGMLLVTILFAFLCGCMRVLFARVGLSVPLSETKGTF